MSTVLCRQCNQPIESREDLIVTINTKSDLVPFHVDCYEAKGGSKLWKSFHRPQMGGTMMRIGRVVNKIGIVGIRIYLIGILVVTAIAALVIQPFSIYVVLIGLMTAFMPYLYLKMFQATYKYQEDIEKESWERFQSKLPVRKL